MFLCFTIALSKLMHLFFIVQQGAVGLAIWVPSVVNQSKDGEPSRFRTPRRGYSSLSSEDRNSKSWRRGDSVNDLELTSLRTDNYDTYNEEMLLDDLKVCRPLILIVNGLADAMVRSIFNRSTCYYVNSILICHLNSFTRSPRPCQRAMLKFQHLPW